MSAVAVGVRGWFFGVDLHRWRWLRVQQVDTYTDVPRRRYATTSVWFGPFCVMSPGRFYWATR